MSPLTPFLLQLTMESVHEVTDPVSNDFNNKIEEKGDVYEDYIGTNVIDLIDPILLDELAPNGEHDYILEHIANMSEQDAIEIVKEGIEEHTYDWSFPKDMLDRMNRLMDGPSSYGKMYERDLKIDAVLLRYSSPYPEVRAIAPPTDDPTIPVETIRAYVLGYFWACIGTFVGTLYNSRFPQINLSSTVVQVILYPCGLFLAKVMPDWGITIWGTRHSLNPGPWTYKEQIFSTITYAVGGYATNAYTTILVQKNSHFYDEGYITAGYQIMMTLYIQIIGMGFAGLVRRWAVYPVSAIWFTNLPIVAMNRALLAGEIKETIFGWSISRYKFFFIVFISMFFYYWLPGYLFTALATFNWMTWIAPKNYNLAVITGSSLGLGVNPWPTFDWNTATSSYQALAQPFYVVGTQYIGSVIGFFIIVGMFYTNYAYTGYLPPNSSSAFANDGTSYSVTDIVANNTLIESKYQQYSPPFYSAGYLLLTGCAFAFYPMFFCYIFYTYWRIIKKGFVDFYNGLRYRKYGLADSNDVHARLLSKYKEVPDWWFLIILGVCLTLCCVFFHVYPIGTPYYIIFLCIGLNMAFQIPEAIVSAVTGTDYGLSGLLQVITGYLCPGNPNAYLISQALGNWAIVGQADGYCSDLKLAYYSKIPQRAVFRCQISGVILVCFVAVGTQLYVYSSIDGLCDLDQPHKYTCANDGYPLYTNSLMWGLLGSKRIFDGMYPILKWCSLMGFVLFLLIVPYEKYGPGIGNRIRNRIREKLSESKFQRVDSYILQPLRVILTLNPIMLLQGIQHWSPSNLSYKTTGLYISYIFMYHIRKRYTAWFEKYNYILSAGLTAGIAFTSLIMMSTQNTSLTWWGTTVSSAGDDGSSLGLLPIPERGYFGPEKGHFP